MHGLPPSSVLLISSWTGSLQSEQAGKNRALCVEGGLRRKLGLTNSGARGVRFNVLGILSSEYRNGVSTIWAI